MNNLKRSAIALAAFVLMSSVPGAYGQSKQPPTNYVKSSSGSATDAPKGDRGIIASCAAAAEELERSRTLVSALESENHALKERLETEKRTSTLLTELNHTRLSETEVLRAALSATRDSAEAKQDVIAAQEKLIDALKRKKTPLWKRLGDVLVGAAVIAILK